METFLYMWEHGFAPFLNETDDDADVEAMLKKIYAKSVLNNPKKLEKLLDKDRNKMIDAIRKDPAVELFCRPTTTAIATASVTPILRPTTTSSASCAPTSRA